MPHAACTCVTAAISAAPYFQSYFMTHMPFTF